MENQSKWWIHRPVSPLLEKISIIGGLLLTAVATALAILAINQATKIEGMQDVIKRLDTSNTNAGKIIDKAAEQISQNGEQLDELKKIVDELKKIVSTAADQNYTYKTNTAPAISLVGNYTITKINDRHLIYTIGVVNVGGRTARKFSASVTHYYITENSKFKSPPADTATSEDILPQMATDLVAAVRAKDGIFTAEALNNTYIKIRYSYTDQLTNRRVIGDPFYMILKVNENMQVTQTHSVTDEIKKEMDALDRVR